MAKTAWREREKRKRKVVDKYAELRAELKKKGDYLALAQLPRNASPVRLSNRCRVSGRKRAFLREFQMSRLTFRELACAGLIPGGNQGKLVRGRVCGATGAADVVDRAPEFSGAPLYSVRPTEP